MATLPLDDLRVIDLSHYIAGPFCTRLLADYGADVVKIERAPSGDPARMLPPFYKDEPGLERSGLFLFLNTNKRSVVLDLKSERGKEILLELVRDADVLVESFRPGVMARLGLDYSRLSQVNPRLIMTSISNFGQTGPYRDWKGTDLTIWGMGGAMNMTGHPEHEPIKLAGHAASSHLGYAAALATVMSLLGAGKRGEGEYLDVNFFRTASHSIDMRLAYLMSYEYTGRVPVRQIVSLGVGSGTRPCADGFFTTTVLPTRFADFARMIGAEHLLEDTNWATPAARMAPERFDEMEALVVPWMLERSKKEIRALHQTFGILGAPLNTTADVFEDEQLRFRRFFQKIDHPTTGPIEYPGYHFAIHTEDPRGPRRRAPLLGEHTDQVLAEELGMPAAEIASLRVQGVVGPSSAPPSTPMRPAARPAARRVPAGGTAGSGQLAKLPLEGVRIVDLTVVWAGPYAAEFLADWGAEVIRIESLQHFAPTTRGMMARPPAALVQGSAALGYANNDPGPRPWNRTGTFNGHGRNKLAMTVDLTRPEGQEVLHRLVRVSDGLIENNVPVSMEHIGVTWGVLSKVNPRLVMLRQPAFGLEGPYKDYRTFGSHMEAVLGHPILRAYPDPDISLEFAPQGVPSDAAGGVGGAFAFLLGLRQREKTGKGVYVELATAENYAGLVGEFMMDYTMNGRVSERLGNQHPLFAPHNAYRCQGDDRWVTIAATGGDEWKALCRVMGNPSLTADPRFEDRAARVRNQQELDRIVSAWTKDHDAHWIMHQLQMAGVPAGVVMKEPDLFNDPHLASQGFWEVLTHPEVGTHRYPGFAWTASKTPNHLRRHAPRLGEDNEYVYKQLLGFTDEEYRRFEAAGHIGMDYDPSVA